MGEAVDPKKKKVVPSSKVPESGAGSRDAGSYGAARLLNTPFAQDVGGAFKKAGSFLKDVSGKMVDNQVSTENNFNENIGTAKRYFLGTTDLSPEKRELDQALRQNTFKPSTLSPAGSVQNSPGSNPTNTVPSKLIGAQQDAGTSRFDKSKLTLGNNPYTGQVGMFKDGQMLDPSSVRLSGGNLGGTPLPDGQSPFFMKSEAAKGLVPQPGTASAVPGTQQSPAATMLGGNWTGMLNQDDAIFKARMANIGKDYRVGAGNPAFAKDPQMAQLLARRDSLQSNVDTFNRQNPLDRGASVGDIISNRAATYQQRKEIEGLNKDIFGHSDLGTKLQMAMLDSLTKKDISRGDNQTKLAQQNMENQGMFDTHAMMEANANARHVANIQAGVGQPKPGEDPWDDKFLAEVGKDYFKALREGGNPGDMDEYLKQAKSYALKARAGKKGMLADILETE